MIGDIRLGALVASAFPSAVVAQNKKGKTPLHFAAREGHIDMVKFLIQLDPSSARFVTDKLKLPLHFAAGEGHADICRYLLNVYPQGASSRSAKGKLPLHLASRWGNMDTIQALVTVYPQGLQQLDWESSTTLHIALKEESNHDIATHLIRQCPGALQVRNISGDLPLDIALRQSSTTLDLMMEMIEIWPKSSLYVLRNMSSKEDIEDLEWEKVDACIKATSFLLQRELEQRSSSSSDTEMSDSSEDDDSSSHGPIEHYNPHGLLNKGAKCIESDVESLDFFPDQSSSSSSANSSYEYYLQYYQQQQRQHEQKDQKKNNYTDEIENHEYLPIHTVLKLCKNESLIRQVIEAYPDQVDKLNLQNNELPLHVACMHCQKNNTVIIAQDILDMYPDAITCFDEMGRLPLHMALCHGANFSLVERLIDAYPASMLDSLLSEEEGRYEMKNPLLLATEFGCELAVVYFLLRRDPNAFAKDLYNS